MDDALFVCAITHDVTDAPVIAQDGHLYDLEAIDAWLRQHGTSPMTRKQIQRVCVRPAIVVAAVAAFRERAGPPPVSLAVGTVPAPPAVQAPPPREAVMLSDPSPANGSPPLTDHDADNLWNRLSSVTCILRNPSAIPNQYDARPLGQSLFHLREGYPDIFNAVLKNVRQREMTDRVHPRAVLDYYISGQQYYILYIGDPTRATALWTDECAAFNRVTTDPPISPTDTEQVYINVAEYYQRTHNNQPFLFPL